MKSVIVVESEDPKIHKMMLEVARSIVRTYPGRVKLRATTHGPDMRNISEVEEKGSPPTNGSTQPVP